MPKFDDNGHRINNYNGDFDPSVTPVGEERGIKEPTPAERAAAHKRLLDGMNQQAGTQEIAPVSGVGIERKSR